MPFEVAEGHECDSNTNPKRKRVSISKRPVTHSLARWRVGFGLKSATRLFETVELSEALRGRRFGFRQPHHQN